MKMWEKIKAKSRKMYDTGALHITLGTFLTKFVAFFGSIVVVRLLSKEEYGVMSYVENIYSYALIFAALGMSNAVLRYLVIAESNEERRQYFNYIIKRSFFINLGISLILLFASQLVVFPENYSAAKQLLPILALLLPFQDLLNDDLYTIRSFFKNKLYAYAAFFSSAALIVGRIVGAIACGVSGVLWSRVVINMLLAISGLCYVSNKLLVIKNTDRLDKEKKRIIDNYSLQYMVTNGFWAIFMLNDKFLLGLLLNDPAGLADYNVASVLPGNIAIFATAIGSFVGPYFTKNEKNNAWIRRNYKTVFILSAGIVGAVAFGIGVVARPLIKFMYGEQYLNVIALMRVLLIGAFFNSGLRYTTANLLAAMGEIKYNMAVSGAGIIIQIVLDCLLIPQMGVMAVAVSNCVVFMMMAIVLCSVFYNKFYRVNGDSFMNKR